MVPDAEISLRSPDGRLISIRPIDIAENMAERFGLIDLAASFQDDEGRCYRPMADGRGFFCRDDEQVYERLL